MRKADAPSVVLEMNDKDDWPGLFAALREADLCRNLRVQLGGFEHRPFSQAASGALDWAFDPANGLVEQVGTALLPACGDGNVEAWRDIGRLLAKCAMDSVEVRSALGELFFRYLGTGHACMQLQPTMELLAEHYPDQATEWSVVLAQRLGGGTPGLTTRRHAGYEAEGAVDGPVCDGNKRDVVRRWARHLLVVQRQTALDAARSGFVEVGGGWPDSPSANARVHCAATVHRCSASPRCHPAHVTHGNFVGAQAFDWGDLLTMLCTHADDIRVLLSSDLVISADDILRCMQFPDVDAEPNAAATRGYLQHFLRACPALVRQQFVARATAALDAAKPVVVSLCERAAEVTFVRQHRLVR